MTDIQNLYRRFRQAQSLRSSWESVWAECYQYALPIREGMFNQNANPVNSLFDGTAPDSVDQLAALVLSEMTPPWMRWFHLTAGADLTDEERDVVCQNYSADWYKSLAYHLADVIKDIGDEFDIRGGLND